MRPVVALRMHLIFALIWAIMALVLLIWPVVFPDSRPWKIYKTDFNLGWLALAFSLYTLLRGLARWWTARSLQQQRQTSQEDERRRRAERLRRRPQQAPDPTFDFTEGPPPPRRPGP
jgi:hypothetical protein